jgi:hypothetical protein
MQIWHLKWWGWGGGDWGGGGVVRRWDEYLKNGRQSQINLAEKPPVNEIKSIYFLAAPFENNIYKSTYLQNVSGEEEGGLVDQ